MSSIISLTVNLEKIVLIVFLSYCKKLYVCQSFDNCMNGLLIKKDECVRDFPIQIFTRKQYILTHTWTENTYRNSSTSLCSRNFQNVKLRLDCWILVVILSPLRFYVKSNFDEFNRSKDANFNFEFLVNLGLESCSNLLKSKFRTSRIVKINIFGPLEFTKIRFHVKSAINKF